MNRSPKSNNAVKDREAIKGLARIFLAVFSLMTIAWFGGVIFEKLDYHTTGNLFISRTILFKFIPFPEFWATALHPSSWRYYIVPIGAMFGVFLGAAYYVKDIYALQRLRDSLEYIISSMTATEYPSVTIDGGEVKPAKGKPNLIEMIGGPGDVVIQPGNVVMFRDLRKPSNIILGENYFLKPFETIGQIASLDDQDDFRDGVTAVTRDGIKITIYDLHYRFKIFPKLRDGRPVRRTLSDPYPFDLDALWNIAYNLQVEETGKEFWRKAVGRAIVGGVTDFINAHNVDYLTAPRNSDRDPRVEIRNSLFYGGTRNGLRGSGAEILWVDIGHFAIENAQVDDVRMDRWAADWLGKAGIAIEEGKTWRQIVRDRGRAEGQAAMITAIADSLNGVANSNDPAGAMRRILLVKTAQLMDAANDSRRDLP